MRWHLPPLNAVRAFEATSRHLSVTKAANELNVTPGAVSRQVRLLEEFLGQPLLQRTSKGLVLTENGAMYAKVLTEQLSQLDLATSRLLEHKVQRPLSIASQMTFTVRWLLPRMRVFREISPETMVRIVNYGIGDPVESDILTGQLDVALRFGSEGQWSKVHAERLLDSRIVAVARPALLPDGKPLKNPAELRNYTLLYSAFRPLDWNRYLGALGLNPLDLQGRSQFESSNLAYQAAIEGFGVALAEQVMVADDIASGRLTVAYDLELKTGDGYYLIYSDRMRGRKEGRLFYDWITEEARKYR